MSGLMGLGRTLDALYTVSEVVMDIRNWSSARTRTDGSRIGRTDLPCRSIQGPVEPSRMQLGRQLELNGDRLCLVAGQLPTRWQRLLATHLDLFVRLFLSLQSRTSVEDLPALLLKLKFERDEARTTVCRQSLELAQLRAQLARLQHPIATQSCPPGRSFSQGETTA